MMIDGLDGQELLFSVQYTVIVTTAAAVCKLLFSQTYLHPFIRLNSSNRQYFRVVVLI